MLFKVPDSKSQEVVLHVHVERASLIQLLLTSGDSPVVQRVAPVNNVTVRIGNLGFRSPLGCAVISLHVTSAHRARCLCRDVALVAALA